MLDSVGAGELPDASAYGDEGSDTLGNIARHIPLAVPTLRALGLGDVAAIGPGDPAPTAFGTGAFGRMAEASPGKDSVTGHWEMMGVVLERPFPVFPNGFSSDRAREVFEGDRARGHREQGGIGHGDHRRTGPRARALGRVHRVHVGRQRLSNRRPRRHRLHRRTLSRMRDRLSPRGRRTRGWPRDRAPLRGRARAVRQDDDTAATTPFRRSGRRCSIASKPPATRWSRSGR